MTLDWVPKWKRPSHHRRWARESVADANVGELIAAVRSPESRQCTRSSARSDQRHDSPRAERKVFALPPAAEPARSARLPGSIGRGRRGRRGRCAFQQAEWEADLPELQPETSRSRLESHVCRARARGSSEQMHTHAVWYSYALRLVSCSVPSRSDAQQANCGSEQRSAQQTDNPEQPSENACVAAQVLEMIRTAAVWSARRDTSSSPLR